MNSDEIFLAFPVPLYEAIYLNRPQRFLAEVSLCGRSEIVYCANPGSMSGCLKEGSRALVWKSSDSRRRRTYTWRAVEFGGVWICTDTHFSNRIVEEVLKQKLIPSLTNYSVSNREKIVEPGFRVDFVLVNGNDVCFVEVKTAVVVNKGIAQYPDSVTPRGRKQLESLTKQALIGIRSMVIFLVPREDAHSFFVTSSRDPAYAEAFLSAVKAGVEVLALGVSVSHEGFSKPRILSQLIVAP